MAITVFSKPACVQCDATYRSLDKLGLPVERDAHIPYLFQVVPFAQLVFVAVGNDAVALVDGESLLFGA